MGVVDVNVWAYMYKHRCNLSEIVACARFGITYSCKAVIKASGERGEYLAAGDADDLHCNHPLPSLPPLCSSSSSLLFAMPTCTSNFATKHSQTGTVWRAVSNDRSQPLL